MDETQSQEGSTGPAPCDNEPGGSSIEGPVAADVMTRLARLRAEPREARQVLRLPNRTQQLGEQNFKRNRFQSRNNIPSHRGNANARGNFHNQGNFNNRAFNRGGPNSFQRNTQPLRFNNQQPGYQQRDSRTMNRPTATAALVADWSQFRSVRLDLRGVPRNATTWDLYNSLSPIGNITWIAIEEDGRGERSSEAASIRFEPPPTDRILPGTSIQIKVGQRAVWVMVASTVPTKNDGAVRSPLGQKVSAKVSLKPTKLSFGITTEPNVVMDMRSVQSLGLPGDFVLTMDFYRQRVTLDFPVLTNAHPELDACECYYRMETKFDTLRKVYRVCNDNTKAIVLTLDSPPRFYRRKNDIEQTHASGKLNWTDQELLSRIVDILHLHDPAESSITPSSLENNHSEIDLGRWTTYWFELDDAAQREWAIIESALQDWNIKTKHDDTMQLVPRAEPQLWSWLEDATATTDNTALLASAPRITLPFDVRYQLEVCISHDVFEARNITREFLLKLASLADTRTMSSNRARLMLEYAADQNKRIWDPMSLFNDKAALTFYPTTSHIPHYCALVRKVTVTPTRIYFHSPTVETTNRVIRHFKQEEDFFLRVQFMDELTEGRINGSDTIRDNELYIRAFRLMNNGIKMGRWQWNFLAFGNSQIRENGAFFFCEPVGAPKDSVTCDKIRAWMGRFSHIKVAAKYAARLGQCFSTTRLLRGIPAPTIVNIPDVERGDHCFTDGVGKMSPLLAQMIAEDWQLDAVPSACQFRMGGCKGVLVTWPEAKGIEVHIRKSQEKFHSEFNGLEIIRFSSFSVATLNRQTITILSSLGVPDQVFVDLLQQQLTNYNRAMTDRAYAVQLLQQYVDENQVTVGIARMLLDGFMETGEPFVMAMMQLWRSWSIKGLKEKARIVVDDGAFVIGCIDETRTLKGHIEKKRRRDARPVDEIPEIFLQVSDPKDRGSLRIITGVCLVGRNPSLHPGDIRVVKAVDVPALRHLSDVVVFPMQGDQDIPSMCSGGDLDGDDYFVIWNQDMIPTQWFHPPMDYTPPPPQELDRDPNVMDLKVFFSLYMKNFSLPIIAHAHLAQADHMDSGAKDPRCIELAKLHSKAVDYVKTGVPAIVEKTLLPQQGYPHFMEKRGKRYTSRKVLGQLYDKVHHVNFRPNYAMPFDDRILKRYQLDSGLLKKVRGIKSQYDTAMRRIMGQMEIRTEFEILSTFVMSKPKVGTPYKLHEIVRRESDALKTQFKDICINEAGGSRDYKQLAPFVAAMYQVTAEEVRIALHEARTPHILKNGSQGLRHIKPESMPLISFPWLFDGILGRIAKDSPGIQHSEEQLASKTAGLSDAATLTSHVGSMDHEAMGNMEYARTNDGRVVHRGQILRLFHLDDDEDDVDIVNNAEVEGSFTADANIEQEHLALPAPDGDSLINNEEPATADKSASSSTQLQATASISSPNNVSGPTTNAVEAPITAIDAPVTASPVSVATLKKASSITSQASTVKATTALDMTTVGQNAIGDGLALTNTNGSITSVKTPLQANIKSPVRTQTPAGPASIDEANDLIDLSGSPRKVNNYVPDRAKMMELAQRLKTVGLEPSDENLSSAATSPTLCDPMDTLDDGEESALDLAKVSDTESDFEVEEVTIGQKTTTTALEHLAKLS